MHGAMNVKSIEQSLHVYIRYDIDSTDNTVPSLKIKMCRSIAD